MNGHDRLTEAWTSIVASALLGTERRPLEMPALEGDLGGLLAQAGESAQERALLGAAALLAGYRRAGRQQAVVGKAPLPPPCEPERLPYCSPRAAGHLALMLSGQHQDILPEWLGALAGRGKLVPPEHLAALLDLSVSQLHLRDEIVAVMGERGLWLAAQNPEWDYVRAEEGDPDSWEALWETGSFEVRRDLLRRMRRSHPARARALVAGTWQEDKASERSNFIDTFRAGLSPEDEPFLEAALDDRSKDVRLQAADVLSMLPGSGLLQRAKENVSSLITYREVQKRKLFGGAEDKSFIEVVLPESYMPQMKRDGVQQKPSDSRMGERAYWLSQQLERIPPSFWNKRWGVSAADILAAAQNTKEWRDMLMGAWTEATRRHGDVEWARAFLAHSGEDLLNRVGRGLLSVLPPAEREAFVLDVLKRNHSALYTSLMPVDMLWQLQTPWSMELSRAVLKSLRRHTSSMSAHGSWEIRQSLPGLARSMPPSILDEAAAALAQTNDYFIGAVDELLATLQFRRDMLKELN